MIAPVPPVPPVSVVPPCLPGVGDPSASPLPADLRSTRVAILIQLLTNAAVSASGVFIPMLALALGAGMIEVGLIGAAYGLMLFLSSSVFGRAADLYGRKRILRIGLLLCIPASLLQLAADTPMTLLLSRALLGLCAGIFPAALVAYAYESGGRLSRLLAMGSLGFGLGAMLAGFLTTYWRIFTFSATLFALALGLAMVLPASVELRVRVPLIPVALIRRNLPLFVAVLLRHTGAMAVWLIFPIYLELLGASLGWIGVIYFINPLAQFFLMPRLDRFPSHRLVLAGLGLSGLYFLLLTPVSSFWFLVPTQLVLASAWSCIYVGAVRFVVEKNPERATSAGLLSSTLGISTVLGPLLGGGITRLLGARPDLWSCRLVMLLAAAMAAVGGVIFWHAVVRNRPTP